MSTTGIEKEPNRDVLVSSQLEEIQNDAYTISEATNDNGTVTAELSNITKVTVDNYGTLGAFIDSVPDDIDVINVAAVSLSQESPVAAVLYSPLVPDKNQKIELMDWPTVEDDEYKLVQLCDDVIGGFANIGQIEGERIVVNPNTWEIDLYTDIRQKLLRMYSVASVVQRIFHVGVIGSLLVGVAPFIMLLLSPFGVPTVTVNQGVSMAISGVVLFIVTMAAMMYVDDRKHDAREEYEAYAIQ